MVYRSLSNLSQAAIFPHDVSELYLVNQEDYHTNSSGGIGDIS